MPLELASGYIQYDTLACSIESAERRVFSRYSATVNSVVFYQPISYLSILSAILPQYEYVVLLMKIEVLVLLLDLKA